MSFVRSLGFYVSITDPVWFAKRQDYELALDSITAWGHDIEFDYGYKSAKMSFSTGYIDAQEWLSKGLGRHIEFFDASQVKQFEGFVNSIKIGLGPLVLERGPLLEIANRVTVVYTPVVDASVDPIVTGAETETVIAEDTASQALYAIQEEIIAGGTLMDDATYTGDVVTNEAEAVRDTYLKEFAYPQLSQEINIGEGDLPYVEIDIRGYRDFLSRYVYNNTIVAPATTVFPDKIKAVLTADPNSIFSTNYEFIYEFPEFLQLTQAWENENRTAETIIDEIVSMGTAGDRRTFFSVYNDRVCHYNQIPTTLEYEYRINEGQPVITDLLNDAIIPPWEVRPGKWIVFPDASPGQTIPIDNLREDPRIMFIESVKYSAPYGLQLTGGKFSTWRKYLEKYGVL